ncbi:MAG: isoaspartyl peptidase/L-asparaginase [Nitrososphaerota archaeon]|nr:isoaspartyl peptidase/L-asparaginase [Nitrososphaerota archaeon]
MMKASIVIHGGAINPDTGAFAEGVSAAAKVGMEVLSTGRSSVDAVTEAIRLLERNPIFNAGVGAWPNLKGEVELDAMIMEGKNLKSGAVAAARNLSNPILVARKVMEETDHILLAGRGAEDFAKAFKLYEEHKVPEARMKDWNALKSKLTAGESVPMLQYWKKISKWAEQGDTVGAVAIDHHGLIAAATSSGGFPMKMPGRVGDVPIIGCSTYADNEAGGVSITGHGEVVMTNALAKSCVDLMRSGISAEMAIESMAELINNKTEGKIILCIIGIDKKGRAAIVRNVDATPHAFFDESMKAPNVQCAKKVVLS